MKNTVPEGAILRFSVGVKQVRAYRIQPIFLPFAGCPQRCVFCAQDRQTGHNAAYQEKNLFNLLQSTHQYLVNLSPFPELLRHRNDTFPATPSDSSLLFPPTSQKKVLESPELAFYGGTFTALPAPMLTQCLEFFRTMRKQKLVSCGRCSTRPDAISSATLALLRDVDIDLIELGVQSYDNNALEESQRGYTAEQAWRACQTVKNEGFQLGIQLLPGMPGVSPEVFLSDVDSALSCRPDCLRFYPCLVPDETPLAIRWQQGTYTPWTIDETVATLGEALRRAWQAHVPVLRLSVAPEATFDASILAGPRHPALGAMIQAEALLRTLQAYLASFPHYTELYLPRACQGFLYGQKNSLRDRWNALGLTPEHIHFTHDTDAALASAPHLASFSP